MLVICSREITINISKTEGIYWTEATLGTTIPLASELVMTTLGSEEEEYVDTSHKEHMSKYS
jgi:hypothetical protein